MKLPRSRSDADRGECEALPLTRLIATLGPATATPARLRGVIEAGVSILRLNFSHGTLEGHAKQLAMARDAAEAAGRTVAILGDLRGPRIRLVPMAGPAVRLKAGEAVEFARDAHRGTRTRSLRLALSEPAVLADLAPGHRVLIADGTMCVRVESCQRGVVTGRVEIGGRFSGSKGVNLPDSRLSLPSIGPHDQKAIEWSVRQGIDLVALSFVRRAEDLQDLRRRLRKAAGRGRLAPATLAKIERPEAIARLEAIVDACDGIMVARGDLGAEMGLEAVPPLQRRILTVAHDHGRPVIIATEVLQSMVRSATPTRAEVGDLSRAVLDEADAVMLSGETAIGRHPARVVATAARILRQAERWSREAPTPSPGRLARGRLESALAHAAWQLALELGAEQVLVSADEPELVRHLAQNPFSAPLVVVGSDAAKLRQLLLHRGVVPLFTSSGGAGRDAALRALAESMPTLCLGRAPGRVLAVGRLAGGGVVPIDPQSWSATP